MAITGAHVLLYSNDEVATRDALRDVFGWRHVDAGGGWLIFALPPAEAGVHPAGDTAPHHELSFLCDDLAATVEELRAKGIAIGGEPHDEGWGIAVTAVLPGDVEVIVYEARHQTAI